MLLWWSTVKGTPSSALEHTTQRKQPGWYEFPRACRIWEPTAINQTHCELFCFYFRCLCSAHMVQSFKLIIFSSKIHPGQVFHGIHAVGTTTKAKKSLNSSILWGALQRHCGKWSAASKMSQSLRVLIRFLLMQNVPAHAHSSPVRG